MPAVPVSRRTGQRMPTRARGGASPTTRPGAWAQDVQRTISIQLARRGRAMHFPDEALVKRLAEVLYLKMEHLDCAHGVSGSP